MTAVHTGEPPMATESTAIERKGPETPAAQITRVEADTSAIRLLEIAVNRGASVEELKELNALREKIEAGEARKLFFRALAEFQKECPPIRKTKTAEVVSERSATTFGYAWAPLDEIDRTIRPILTKHGLSYTWDQEQEGNGLTTVCVVRHEAGHSERTPLKLNIGGSPGMSEHQKVASTMQFGKRQSLTSALGLSTTDEIPDVEDNREKITDDQAIALTDLLTETRTPPARFLKHFQVERVEDLRAIDYDVAIATLNDRKKDKPK